MNLPRFRSAFSAGGFAIVVALECAAADDPTNPATLMEKYEVTGSHIKRVDLETPSPVVRFTRDMLEASGFADVDEALRSLPINNGQAISFEGSGNALATGTSTTNLRGLGNNHTLVLIDGRRASPAGVGAFNGFQSVIDLRQVPMAWVDSIEVLKDGASAIYGSDAVSGVVNIKLRTNYSGVNVSLQVGNTLGTDSFQRSANFIAGAQRGSTRIVIMGAAAHRNAIKDIDYAFSSTADLRANRASPDPMEMDPSGKYTIGLDQRSTNTFPARFYLPNSTATRTFAGPTDDPAPNKMIEPSRVTGAGFFDFQKETYQLPETDTRSVRALFQHDFTDQVYGRLDFSFQHGKLLNAAASSPFGTSDKGAGSAGRLVIPVDSPFNPYGRRYESPGREIELSTLRLVNAGPRFHDVVADYPRLLAVVGGKLPAEWTWEAGHLYARGSYRDTAPGASFDSKVQAALKGVVIDGEKLFANPFGPEDARVTNYYSGQNPTEASFTSHLSDVSATGDLFHLPAGDVALAVGGELRHERLVDVRTPANESGDIVGGGEGFGFSGSRRVISGYAEMKVPVLKSLELQLAGRMEKYSDFGSTTKPKIAFGYRPAKWLMLRGSFSQSFKAPDIAYLRGKGNVSFTASALTDPRRLDRSPVQIRTVGRGNPALKPEETNTYYAGVVLELPRGPLQGLTFDLAYYRFSQTNLIVRDDAGFTLTNEQLLPAGRVVRKPPTPSEVAAGYAVGTIDFLANDWYNADKLVRDGYDFGIRLPVNTRAVGRFDFSIDTTYLANSERTVTNSLGRRNVIDEDGKDPVGLWRGTGAVAWRKGAWSSSIYVVGVGGFYPGQLARVQPPMKDQYIVNPQIAYAGLWGTKITVGMRNVLNEDPPRYIDNQTGYYPQINRAEKAFWYLRLSREL